MGLLRIVRGSPTLANLENDRGFTSKKYIYIEMRSCLKTKSKVMRAYIQMEQYRAIV